MGSPKIAFLMEIEAGRDPSGRIPSWLYEQGWKVASGRDGVTAEDLVQAFLASLVPDGSKRRARVVWGLMTEAAAMVIVRRRMKQLACEEAEGWNPYRALRAHVRDVLEAGLDPAPLERPCTLCEGDRMSSRLVAEAVSWVVAREHVRAEVADVTRALRGYLLQRAQPAANEDLDRPAVLEPFDPEAELPDEHLEVQQLANTLVRRLGTEHARLYGQRLAERTLKEVGAGFHLPVTTVFDHARDAERVTKQVLVESGCSPRVARRVLRTLVEHAS